MPCKPSVRAAFPTFTAQYEGVAYEMYCDIKGLVTTGIGNLIDPYEAASQLPWRVHLTGALATPTQVLAEWSAVKNARFPLGRGPRALYLSHADVQDLVDRRFDANDVFLETRFRNWEDWPADAQLAAHSDAWAAGPGWNAPRFTAAVLRGDWETAAAEVFLNDAGNPGLHPRNVANHALMMNAAFTPDPETLQWPKILTPDGAR